MPAAALAWLAGCSQPRATPCPRTEPAFRLQVTAESGELPADTRLDISYQGSRDEGFDFHGGGADNVDVCCRAGSPVPESSPLPSVPCGMTASSGSSAELDGAAADAGSPMAILCELWTNGPAQVDVAASEYDPFGEMFQSVPLANGCGVETQDERVVLRHQDAVP